MLLATLIAAKWAEDAAKMCVQVCEMQFGGWKDANGLHLFSDHPSLCIARLHHAHCILSGRIGHRNLKLANKILSDSRDALYAWSGAKKARETRLKLSTMKNWKVRTDEERSDELTTPPQAVKTTRARTSVHDTTPP